MGSFKSEVKFLEKLETRQIQIWPDSADSGIRFSDLTEQEIAHIKECIRTLLELPGSKVIYRSDTPAVQRQYHLIVMWGCSNAQTYDATSIDLPYYKGHGEEFISIIFKSIITDVNGVEKF